MMEHILQEEYNQTQLTVYDQDLVLLILHTHNLSKQFEKQV